MTIEELRVIISAKTEKLQEGINRATSRLNSFRESSDETSNAVNQNVQRMREQYDQLVRKLDIVNAQAETQQRKLNALRERYSSVSALDADSPTTVRLQEQIINTEARLERLINTSDRTANSIQQLEDSMANTSNATQNANSGISSLRDTISNASNRVRQATNNTRRLGREINTTGERAKRSTGKIAGFAKMIDGSFKRILKRIFIYNLIYKAIRGLIGYMGGALKTNNQFADSLQIIKTNLRVAFQPIYDFILPAINALMKALATLSTYIASFTSALFGKTYKQSYDAAKGIETARKEMDGYGKSAKKAKGQTAGFDEINQLDLSKDDESSGGANEFEMSMPDISSVDMSGIEELKQSLSELFQPFKDAWENEGARTIESAKNAFDSVKALLSEIGKSFKEVWTGGKGQEILESWLRILQIILGIVGDIATAFRNAWKENNQGTKLMDSIADAIQNILLLIESVGISWREVWNNGTGQEMIGHILSILQQVFDLVGNIADSFRTAWELDNTGINILQNIADFLNIILGIFEEIGESLNKVWGEVGQDVANTFMKLIESASGIIKKFGEALRIAWDGGGKHLFESLLRLGAKVIEVAGVIWNEFVDPVVKWLLDIFGPAFGNALDFVADFVDGVIWWLDVLLSGLKIVKEFVDKVVGFFYDLYIVLVGNSIVPDMVNEITEWFKNLYTWVTDKVKELKEAVIKFFTELWNGVLTKTTETWTAIKTFLSDTWGGFKTTATNIFTGIKDTIDNIFNTAKANISNVWDSIATKLSDTWNGIKSTAGDAWNGIWDVIKGVINHMIDGINKFIDYWNNIKLKVPEVNIPFVGKVGGFTIQVPQIANIPMLARGGIVDQPTLAMIGERGKEAVVPLENTAFVDTLAGAIGSAVMGAMQFNNSQNTVTTENREVSVEMDGNKLIRILLPKMNDELIRMGYKSIYQIT